MRQFMAALLISGITVLLAAASAYAGSLPPGVHTDPNSPEGKQYALYPPTARGSGGTPQYPFGRGITKAPPPSTEPGRQRSGGGARGHRGTRPRGSGTRTNIGASGYGRLGRPGAIGAGSSWLGRAWILWIVLLVLLPALTAIIARTRRRPPAGAV